MNKCGKQRTLTLKDLQLELCMKKGDICVEYISCDSAFMLETLPKVGRAIRQKMLWVLTETPIHLIMDKAGGY